MMVMSKLAGQFYICISQQINAPSLASTYLQGKEWGIHPAKAAFPTQPTFTLPENTMGNGSLQTAFFHSIWMAGFQAAARMNMMAISQRETRPLKPTMAL